VVPSDLAVQADLSFGCVTFDTLIAIWFLAGEPSFVSDASTAQAG
jgi:hypothetical protein